MLCQPHNRLHAEQDFGEEHVARAIHLRQQQYEAAKLEKDAHAEVLETVTRALQGLGFTKDDVARAVRVIAQRHAGGAAPATIEWIREGRSDLFGQRPAGDDYPSPPQTLSRSPTREARSGSCEERADSFVYPALAPPPDTALACLIVPRNFLPVVLGALACVSTASMAAAQPQPQPLPPPSVYDFGVTSTAFGRVGYASGYRVGTSLALSYRTTTWPYRSTFGMDPMELALFTNVDRAEMGGRLSPLNFIFSFWSDSVFQGGYGRWNLIDIGIAYRPDRTSSLEVGSSFSVGYSYELSDGIALRIAEIGTFAGIYARSRGESDTKVFFDFGGMLSTGITFR